MIQPRIFLIPLHAGENCLIVWDHHNINRHGIAAREQIPWTGSPSTNEGRHTSLVLTQNYNGVQRIKSEIQLWAAQRMTCFGHGYTAPSVRRHSHVWLFPYYIRTSISKSKVFFKIYKSQTKQKMPFLLTIRSFLIVSKLQHGESLVLTEFIWICFSELIYL